MPTYTVTAPSGKTLRLTGDAPPTEAELDHIFSQVDPQSSQQPAIDYANLLTPDGTKQIEDYRARFAEPEQPSIAGSFFREAARSVAPGAAGFAGGAGAGALAGLAGGPLSPITVPLAALVGGFGSSLIARKGQDMLMDEVAPDSFMGTQSATRDYQANPISTLLGGTLATGRPAPFRAMGALKTVATQEGRGLLAQALQKNAPAIARTALDDVVDVGAGAGIGAGMSLASGDGMALENAGIGLLFNRGWFNGRANSLADSQHGVQGEPATGSPAGGVVNNPIETNAAARTPMVVSETGPLQAAGATRLAADLAARAGIDPMTLTPSGAEATVTPNDVRAAGAKLPATTIDSGGTTIIDPPRQPEPAIADLIGKPVQWDGIDGTLVNDGGRPSLQTADGGLVELPFSYHTASSIQELGITPTGDRVVDRQAVTRLFGDTESGAMHEVFSRISNATDDVLDIADLGASVRVQPGKKGIPVRETPEFAQHARGLTDEALLTAQEETRAALQAAESHPSLTDDTRTAITTKLRGDLENIDGLISSRDAWQRERLPLPTRGIEAPSQRASLAAADAGRNRAAAIAELNRGEVPRPVAETPPPRPLAAVESRLTPEPQTAIVTPAAPESAPAAPEVAPLNGSIALANGRLTKNKNQLAKLEANGKGDSEQAAKLRSSISTLEAQIKAAGPQPESRAKQLSRRVDEVINSGEFDIITKVLQNGGFKPQDRRAGLIESNKQRKAKVSEQSQKIADGFGETRDDAPRPSDFPDTPGGELAAATLRRLHNNSSTAQSVDQIARDLGMTVREFNAKLSAELDSIHRNNGTKASEYDAMMERGERQTVEFEKAVEDAHPDSLATPDEVALEKGDTFTVDGEKIRVVEADGETVTLRDGEKFGTQTVSNDTPLPIEDLTSPKRVRTAEEIAAQKEMDAIANDEMTARYQSELPPDEVVAGKQAADNQAVAKPAAEDFALKAHANDAEIIAEKKAAEQKAEMAKKQAAPLKGNSGDMTADMFGEGDTPLFNERRDTPQQKAPLSRDEVSQQARDKVLADFDKDPAVTPAPPKEYDTLTAISDMANRRGYNPNHLTPDRIQTAKEQGLISGNKNFKLTESGRSKLYEWQRAASDRSMELGSRIDKAVNDALGKFDQDASNPQKSILEGLKAHRDDVDAWIKGEKRSGRMNSMPIDIIGATAYKNVIDMVVAGIEAGMRIGKAVRAAVDHIKKYNDLTREEETVIKAALIKQGTDYQRFAGERNAKFMREMPKLAEEMVAQGKNPTLPDLIAGLAKRFPEHADYIRANGAKIHADMVLSRDTMLSRNTETKREWGEWADKVVEETRNLAHSLRKGAPGTTTKQVATKLHANFMTGIGNAFRHLAEGNITGNRSEAFARFTEELVGLAKGKDGVHRVSDDLRMDIDIKRFANRLDQINQELAPILNKMPRNERKAFMERVGDHVTNPSRDRELANQPELKRAVEGIVNLRKDLLKHMRDNGVQVGDAGERTMRRVLDRPTVLSNPQEFVKQAAAAYKAKWRAEVAALNAEAATLDPVKNKARLASIKSELKEIAERDATVSAKKYLLNIEGDELGITSDGNDIFSHNNGNPSSIQSREFGPEADQLLGKFYRRDPNDILRQEIADSVRAAAVAKTLSAPKLDESGKPLGTGEIDPIGRWKKLREDLINEGNADMVPLAASLIKDFYSLGGSHANPVLRKTLGIAHLHGQMTFLARATLSSMGEPALVALRTGRLMDVASMYVNIGKKMLREIRGLGPDEARVISNMMGASEDGFNSILASNRFLNGDLWEGKGGEIVSMLHTKTFLNAFTNATHSVALEYSHKFIRNMLELREAGGKYKTLAGKGLNEIGIQTKDIPAMLKFTDDLAKATDKSKLLLADTPEARMYRAALHLIKSSGASLTSTRGARPRWASTPVGSMFYAFQSFLFTFQDQILSRHYRLMKTAIKGEAMVDGSMEKLSTAERTKLVNDTLKTIAVIGAAQYAIQLTRENLFSDPARMKDERKTPQDMARMRVLSIMTRSNVFGGYDTLYNMATGARHGADPMVKLLGPSLGLASSTVAQAIGVVAGDKNSPNTNTAERKLVRSAYDLAVKPVGNTLFASMPGFSVPGLGIQALNHPGMREAVVGGAAGPPMKQRGKKGPMRF